MQGFGPTPGVSLAVGSWGSWSSLQNWHADFPVSFWNLDHIVRGERVFDKCPLSSAPLRPALSRAYLPTYVNVHVSVT